MTAPLAPRAVVRYTADYRLSRDDWVGFDLDHTLCRYHVGPLSELIHKCIATFLVEHRGYPAALLAEPYSGELVAKGTLFDALSGDLLKLDPTGRVAAAAHGRRRLTPAEVAARYGAGPWWGFAAVDAHRRHDSIVHFLTYFEVPTIPLFARLVELLDAAAGGEGAAKPYSFLPDVWAGFDHAFSWPNFAAGTGGYFSALRAAPERYIVRRRPFLREWLQRRRGAGQRLFLCTNSHEDYTRFLMDFIAGEGWEQLFDIVIVFAGKAVFFSSVRPYYELDLVTRALRLATELRAPSADTDRRPVFVGGSAAALQALADALVLRDGRPLDEPIELDEHGHVVGPRWVVEREALYTHVQPLGHAPTAEEVAADEQARQQPIVAAMIEASATAKAADHIEPPTGSDRVALAAAERQHRRAAITYVGDHLNSDVSASRKYWNWHTVAIVEELESSSPPGVEAARSTYGPEAEVAVLGVSSWGSIFQADDGSPSYFAKCLAQSADLAVPDISALFSEE